MFRPEHEESLLFVVLPVATAALALTGFAVPDTRVPLLERTAKRETAHVPAGTRRNEDFAGAALVLLHYTQDWTQTGGRKKLFEGNPPSPLEAIDTSGGAR